MAKTPDTAKKIIAAAERRMRDGGFHGFSFRDIAADVGIKSASVHHHFPTKEDLAAAAVRSYSDRHMANLGDPADPERTPDELIALYIDLFRRDIVKDRQMCLCGVLAGETAALGSAVRGEVRAFFDRNRDWLEAVIGRVFADARPEDVRSKALLAIAALEGALLTAHCLGQTDVFERAVAELGRILSA